ncbi:MAG: putative zinc metalloproteinase [Akkermansiaceae bacterium]|nr:putative zinc metalloproteinase [Akkermansiaceae bacterium]
MALEHVRDYVTLSDCYDEFNARLFGGELRGCVLTFEDRGQHCGYYRQGGFVGREADERRDEICLNPRHFLANAGDLELLQTLVHEQVHQWQAQFGEPSRRTYHNREWADKMLEVGLVPSHTGRPGGRMTGQQMADYPEEGGQFLVIANEILGRSRLIKWYKEGVAIRRAQEYATMPDGEEMPAMFAALAAALPPAGELEDKPAVAPTKVGYRCPGCKARVWGKPNLSLICGKCYEGGDVVYLVLVSTYLQATGSWVSARPA